MVINYKKIFKTLGNQFVPIFAATWIVLMFPPTILTLSIGLSGTIILLVSVVSVIYHGFPPAPSVNILSTQTDRDRLELYWSLYVYCGSTSIADTYRNTKLYSDDNLLSY